MSHEATVAVASPGLATDLPDVNVETNPFRRVQAMLDEVAQIDLYARPAPRPEGDVPTLTPYDPADYFGIQGGYGFSVHASLHRFETRVEPGPTPRVRHSVGFSEGSLRGRWLVATEGMPWSPGDEPPPVIFDPWRSQPLALLDCNVEIGERGDGFTGYGEGRTFPLTVDGRPRLLVGAVGTLLAGRGRMEGLEGTFSINGEVTSELGFIGNVTIRFPDPDRTIQGAREVETLSSGPPFSEAAAEDGGTYFVLRGQKENPGVRTEYGPSPGPGLVSLVTPAEMHTAVFPWTTHGRGGLRSAMDVGPKVARLRATVSLDLLAPPGTLEKPNSFTTHNVYTFVDQESEPVGALDVQIVQGRSFALTFPEAPEQPAMRYGGFGPVVSGRGVFEGVRGLVSLNSAIGIAPHALSMINVVRLVDLAGRFRQEGAS